MPILFYRDPEDGTFKPYSNTPVSGRAGEPVPQATTVHNELTGRDAPDAHPLASITGLQTALDGKASVSDLSGKANASHTHSNYATVTVSSTAPSSPKTGDIWCQ